MKTKDHQQIHRFRVSTRIQFLILVSMLQVILIIGGTADVGQGISSGGVAQADVGWASQDESADENDWLDLPSLLVVKVRFAEQAEAFTVESYGLGQGYVLRPGDNPDHRYLYQAVSRSGQVLAEGTFDVVFQQQEADPLSVAPDDVILLADESLLVRIPYNEEIASLRVLKALASTELAALKERAARGERVPAVMRAVRTGQPAVELSSSVVEAATAQPIVEELWLSGGVVFRPGHGRSSGPTDLVTLLQGQVEDNFQVNGNLPRGAAQNEPFIAMNPLDPNNLVAGANEGGVINCCRQGFYSSTNGGRTWSAAQIQQPSGLSFASDPGIAADAQGNFYFSFVAFSGNAPDNGLFVAKSTNGGRIFGSPVVVVQHRREANPDFEDKPFIAADPNPMSPYANNVYVSWTSFLADGGLEIKLSRSTNGARSFSAPVTLRRGGNQQDSLPVVGPDGQVYVVWMRGLSHQVAKSTDGGASFARDVRAAGFIPIGTLDPDTGRRVLNGGFRVSSYPSMAVDTSNGPHRGNLYVVWSDGRNGDADIFFSRSTDGGQTWSAPVRINDDPMRNGKDQFMQWVSVDPTNGNIVVMFYDRRNDPNNLILDVHVTRSTDGGGTFEPNFQVNTMSFNPRNDPVFGGRFVGDYNGVVVHGNLAYPVWTDTRRREQDIFGARVRFGP